MSSTITKQKLDKYFELTNRALEKIKKNIVKGAIIRRRERRE